MLQPALKKVTPLENFLLSLEYETGEHKIFDVKPYIEGEWYKELASVDYFKQVKIIDDGYGIAWPNGQDVAPHELYELSVCK